MGSASAGVGSSRNFTPRQANPDGDNSRPESRADNVRQAFQTTLHNRSSAQGSAGIGTSVLPRSTSRGRGGAGYPGARSAGACCRRSGTGPDLLPLDHARGGRGGRRALGQATETSASGPHSSVVAGLFPADRDRLAAVLGSPVHPGIRAEALCLPGRGLRQLLAARTWVVDGNDGQLPVACSAVSHRLQRATVSLRGGLR